MLKGGFKVHNIQGSDMGRNQDSDRRTRYWSCLSEDLVLEEQEEIKV
jgi:hypothetical protein